MTRGMWSVGLACAVGAATALADEVAIPAAADNTLYESETGHLSNGSGSYFFAGVTGIPELRRGLMRFDVAAVVPEGATIAGATLLLTMSKTVAGEQPVSLHRALAAWGEGASDAEKEEGIGAPAEAGDATWLHTYYDTEEWSTPGGDFAAKPSATTGVAFEGEYKWVSDAMALDVQAWLDDPSSNHGWVVLGNEDDIVTAKRFNSRENEDDATRPLLFVSYEAGGCYPDCDGTGIVNLFDFLCFVGRFNEGDPYADCDGNQAINLFDFFCFVSEFNEGC